MIYDNYDSPDLASNKDTTAVNIDKYLPKSYQGPVIHRKSKLVTLSKSKSWEMRMIALRFC